MKKQLLRIPPVQFAKVLALVYFLISLPLMVFMWLLSQFGPHPQPFSGWFLLMPVFYVIFGFIFSLTGAWIYNLVAKWIGGIEFVTVEKNDD